MGAEPSPRSRIGEMRYRLRTLLIVLALGPPVLAGAWFLWQRSITPLPIGSETWIHTDKGWVKVEWEINNAP
jgi:hypothetical protein